MIKSFIVDSTYNNMRVDRWLRHNIGNLPQSLIEKFLRAGKVKINKKKVKSSFKVKTDDKIEIFNLNFKENIIQKKKTTFCVDSSQENYINGSPADENNEVNNESQ